jgi:N-acetyl-alpha-D-muramate 1-phosphate uridylyltransferase
MTVQPHTAMVLAAGLGQRMRPLTERTAKPLLPLGGRALLDHALDRLAEIGVTTAVVNGFWHADRVEAHLAARAAAGLPPRTIFQHEAALLETGGGVRAALDMLGPDAFYVVNGDSFWLDGPLPALTRLAESFDATVDGVLLVHRTFQVQGDVGLGDFVVDQLGGLRRRREREVAPYIYAGVQLITPTLLDGTPEGAFSMNLAWDRAIAAGRLRAVVHEGLWLHLSTPADLSDAETILQARLTGESR